jgi:hypothetical protein
LIAFERLWDNLLFARAGSPKGHFSITYSQIVNLFAADILEVPTKIVTPGEKEFLTTC